MIDSIDKKDSWLLKKQGKFSASEIWKLLGKAKDGSMFGQVAITYIRQKAVECMTDYWENPKLEFAKPLLHGKAIEYQAFDYYQRITGNYDMAYFGSDDPRFFSYGNDAGGSPDAVNVTDNTIDWVTEIKCPFNPAVHLDHLELKDQYALRDYSPEYYSQIQMLIMTLGTQGAHFFSFDERYKDKNKKGKIIEILPDKTFKNNLDARLEMAVIKRNEIINSLN
jgi:hypothetical protein